MNKENEARMLAKEALLDFETVDQLLYYEDGELYWKVTRNGNVKMGARTGQNTINGYQGVTINNKGYMAHRIIWLLHHKEWPKGMIDHIDRDRSNNRIENLRLSNHRSQCFNRRKRSDNSSGIPGVVHVGSYSDGRPKWRVGFGSWNIGTFDDFFEACCKRKSIEHQLGFEKM